MNGQEIRDRLLHSYERSYDIVKPSEVNGHTYDACASYHESGAKYVLSKKAELWIPTTCTRWSPVFFLRTNRLRTA